MKNFSRTLVGKALIFILCISFLVVFCASAVTAGSLFYLDAYTRSEDDIQDSLISDAVENDAYNYALSYFEGTEFADRFGKGKSNVQFELVDAEGNTVKKTSGYIPGSKFSGRTYSITFGRVLNNAYDVDGNLLSSDVYYYNGQEYYYYEDDYLPAKEVVTRELEDNNASIEYSSSGDPIYKVIEEEILKVNAQVDTGYPLDDFYGLVGKCIHAAYSLRYTIYPIMIVSAALTVFLFVALMTVAGHKPGTDELYQSPIGFIPYDVLLILAMTPIVAAFAIAYEIWDDMFQMYVIFFALFLSVNIALWMFMELAVRIKNRTLIKKSLTYILCSFIIKIVVKICRLPIRFCKWMLGFLKHISINLKVASAFVIISFVELICIMNTSHGDLALLWLFEKVLLFVAVMYVSKVFSTFRKAGAAIAGGDIAYRIDDKYLILDFKDQAKDLNSISSGLGVAVEQRLKSERMKAELITNVSHDIKTPLTSIINYTDLICKEPCENEKITEYAEVLSRQGAKLKRLIEDLVEASKASTGNLEVNPEPCDASIFITQAIGEYMDKLDNANLRLVTDQPDEPVMIMADGRRMWRIFDNLMNNVCKYSMSGTRVYMSLKKTDGNAIFTIKNTSREELNISEEELMERFVRGDSSRNTEGNGLGLSIARSLAELQGGKLELAIDGDLFKVSVIFPVI